MNRNLADLKCDGCGGAGHVRQQRTGKKLLYFYCPTCGMDKRSGAQLQTKWQAAIDGIAPEEVSETPENNNTSQLAEWSPKTLNNVSIENDDKEQSEQIRATSTERSEDRNDRSSGRSGAGAICAGIGFCVLAFFGIKSRLQTT